MASSANALQASAGERHSRRKPKEPEYHLHLEEADHVSDAIATTILCQNLVAMGDPKSRGVVNRMSTVPITFPADHLPHCLGLFPDDMTVRSFPVANKCPELARLYESLSDEERKAVFRERAGEGGKCAPGDMFAEYVQGSKDIGDVLDDLPSSTTHPFNVWLLDHEANHRTNNSGYYEGIPLGFFGMNAFPSFKCLVAACRQFLKAAHAQLCGAHLVRSPHDFTALDRL